MAIRNTVQPMIRIEYGYIRYVAYGAAPPHPACDQSDSGGCRPTTQPHRHDSHQAPHNIVSCLLSCALLHACAWCFGGGCCIHGPCSWVEDSWSTLSFVTWNDTRMVVAGKCIMSSRWPLHCLQLHAPWKQCPPLQPKKCKWQFSQDSFHHQPSHHTCASEFLTHQHPAA